MESSNEKKRRLLGQPYGTASNTLKKMLLFKFAKQLSLDGCHRCSKPIIDIADFSIEHTVPWEGTDNPKETFFDLETIAFSHLGCNSGAGYRRSGPQNTLHGIHRYNKGCRCVVCLTAHSDVGYAWKRKNNYRGINDRDQRPRQHRRKAGKWKPVSTGYTLHGGALSITSVAVKPVGR